MAFERSRVPVRSSAIQVMHSHLWHFERPDILKFLQPWTVSWTRTEKKSRSLKVSQIRWKVTRSEAHFKCFAHTLLIDTCRCISLTTNAHACITHFICYCTRFILDLTAGHFKVWSTSASPWNRRFTIEYRRPWRRATVEGSFICINVTSMYQQSTKML